jgi:hypothetical protein
VQLPKIAPRTRAQAIYLKLFATASLSFWVNRRVIDLFCAQVFGIRKGRAICYSAPPVGNTRNQLSGAASRGARITRPTVERLTPIFRASSFCVAFGFAATSLAIFANTSAGRRGRPRVSRPAFNAIALRSATRHTVA